MWRLIAMAWSLAKVSTVWPCVASSRIAGRPRRGQRVTCRQGVGGTTKRKRVAARTLRGDIWEVRADGNRVIHRVLFAPEGRRGLVLLALAGFTKKTPRTTTALIALAEQRLADWRARGR